MMPGDPPDFSVCMPTHNRAVLLDRVFASLAAQTGATLELVVVNDGSTDDTAERLAALAAAAPFPVVALNIANAGRGAALNRAFDAARGRFVFIMDDDDVMAPGALSDVLSVWGEIPPAERGMFCGVCGLCSDLAGKTIGQRFPADIIDGDFFSMRVVRGIRGDKREVILRSAIGDFRFPVIAGEKRTATNLLWFELARHYRVRFVNRTWLMKDYRPDGITSDGLKQKVASAGLSRHYYQRTLALFPAMPAGARFRFMVNYLRYARHAGEPLAASLAKVGHRGTALLATPIARAVAWNDRRRLAGRATS